MPDDTPKDIDRIIRDPHAYEQAIQHVYDKRRAQNRSFQEAHLGVTYVGISLHRRGLAQNIARSVARGSMRLEPVDLWMLERGGSVRPAHRAILPDQLVGSVVANVLAHNARRLGQPGIYAYQPGLNNYTALSDFAAYLRKIPARQGVFVMQSDFTKYGENIPVHENAHVWKELKRATDLGTSGGASDIAWNLVRRLVRPVVRNDDGAVFTRLFGIPMGTPIVAVASNLAIKPIDEALVAFDGGFYARFNDDFLFAHPDHRVVLEADRIVDSLLEPLGVLRKPEKTKRTYLNAPGRTVEEAPEFSGKSSIQFLGLSVSRAGTIAPSQRRVSRFQSLVCRRLKQAARNLHDSDRDDRVRNLVRTANTMLDPDHPFSPPAAAGLLRDTTDRGVLKDLDYRIARKIAQLASGRPGVRAFRIVTPGELRNRWGLISLVRSRNLQ
ncbi:MAG: hypothetical protein GY789_04400 [Hyphomicrobiales bacterium]|nr:hypothetical protein [Hyphomicrobiales bacterium]